MWEGKPYFADGVLTPEIIEEVAKLAAEQGGYHPCMDGHMMPCPSSYVGAKSVPCLNCGLILVLDKK